MKSLVKRIYGLRAHPGETQRWHEMLNWGASDLMRAYSKMNDSEVFSDKQERAISGKEASENRIGFQRRHR